MRDFARADSIRNELADRVLYWRILLLERVGKGRVRRHRSYFASGCFSFPGRVKLFGRTLRESYLQAKTAACVLSENSSF